MTLFRYLLVNVFLVNAFVESDGRVTYHEMPDFVPPTDPADLPDTPHNPEKIRLMLQYELRKYDNDWIESDGLRLGQFFELQEFSCEQRLLYLADCAALLSERVNTWHLNFTGTAGLWWLHTADPTDQTWAWLIHYFFEKITITTRTYFHKASLMSLDRPECFSSALRKWLTAASIGFKKMMHQHTTLLWNGFAFGMLGDVTTENNTDAETDAEMCPEGICGNGTFGPLNYARNNLIFGHMFTGSINEYLKGHTRGIHDVITREMASGSIGMSDNLRPHHQDEEGHFVFFEALRREVFQQWAVDKGLLRAFLKLIKLDGSVTLGDFGAGGGYYSRWLNETGLVQAFAFDGTPDIDAISAGVTFLNLNEPNMAVWRTFDWVLCLEVAEHIPAQHTTSMLRNLDKYAKDGVIMSWSADKEGIGHVNVMKESDFHSLVEKTIPFRVDQEATAMMRSMCTIEYISRSATVFRRV